MQRLVVRFVAALVLMSIAGAIVWMVVTLADHPERTEQTAPQPRQ